MNRGRAQVGGYTIIELLIFLAVSGAMFFTAMSLVSGQQGKAQFVSTVRDFESKINDIANDVSTGYYNRNKNFGCTVNASNVPVISNTAVGLGQNGQCIYVGTVLKLGEPVNGGKEAYNILTMAGARTVGGANTASLAQSNPRVVYFGGSPIASQPVTQQRVPFGTIECVRVNGGACNAADGAAIGFFTTFNGTSAGAKRGGIQTDLIYYNSPNSPRYDDSLDSAVTKINNFNYASYTRANTIDICVRSGSTNQYALLSFGGGSASNLTVSSEIKQGTTCT